MFGFEKWQRMFADPEIPVRMADPSHIELILKTERKIEVLASHELVKDDAIVNPVDLHLMSVMRVK